MPSTKNYRELHDKVMLRKIEECIAGLEGKQPSAYACTHTNELLDALKVSQERLYGSANGRGVEPRYYMQDGRVYRE